MYNEFSRMQPSWDSEYVLIEWDGVLSLDVTMVKPLFNLLRQMKFTPKVFTMRNKSDDNSDIFEHIEERNVLFSNGEQKKDMIHSNGLKHKEVSYWIDSEFLNIVDKEDLDVLSSLVNNPNTPAIFKDETLSSSKKKYVMIDWDETMSLRSDFTFRFFSLFETKGFIPKILTARNEDDDNDDLLLWVDKKDVIFANRQQKKEILEKNGILLSDVAFWLDDTPSAIVSRDDFLKKLSYYNR